jgi:acid stress chaperone HdeB
MKNTIRQLVLAASGLIFVLNTAAPAWAQVTIDVSKITCDQFTLYKVTSPDNIAIWLSGYYSGKRNSTIVDTQGLAANAKKVTDYCIRNPQIPVMQAVETVLGIGK